MIKNIEMFMELDSQREELAAIVAVHSELSDIAYSKVIECIERDDLIAYGTWMDVVETCQYYIDELNTEIDKIKEKLQEIAGEA